MKTKMLATLMALGMVLTAFSMLTFAADPDPVPTGTPEIALARVNNAVDGTAAANGAVPNGIFYAWEQAEAFVLTSTVATFGANSKGIVIDTPGTWSNPTPGTNSQVTGDCGSIWDAWVTGELAVGVFETFNDQAASGRNYTCIVEEPGMDGDGSTTFSAGSATVALTLINDPTLVGKWTGNNTAMITVATQTTGAEVPAWFTGYGVYKSTTGAITQSNQGTYLGDAVLQNGVWNYRDTAWNNVNSWYAVKVRWNAATFFAPLYSYGMSNDVAAPAESADQATATGPTGTSNDNTPDVTYTIDSGSPASVDVYYTNNGGTTWTLAGTDSPATSPYTTGVLADGTYSWNVKSPSELVPVGAPSIEAGPYTIDTVGPTITSTVPNDGAVGVLTTSTYVATFSEAMDPAVGTVNIVPACAGTWAWSVGNTVYTFTPTVSWAAMTLYTLTFNGFTDALGNAATGDLEKTFTTADPNPPNTAITAIPDYAGTLPDDFTLTVTATDAEGSTPTNAQYRVDAGAWVAMTAGAAGNPRTFTATVDMHNWTLAAHTIDARSSDNGGSTWDATPATDSFNVADTTAPANTRVAPTPVDGANRAPGATVIRVQAHDFRLTTATITVVAPTAGVVGAVMTPVSWALGSNIRTFEYTITENTPGAVTWTVTTTDGTTPSITAGNYNVVAGMLGPNAPYSIYGRTYLYNGAAGVYNPLFRAGASVIAQTVNQTGALLTFGPQVTDAAGNYLFTVQPTAQLVWGNPIFLQATDGVGGWMGWNQTTIVLNSAAANGNITYGIPYNNTITWCIDWTVTPIVGVNVVAIGQAVNVNATIRDNRSLVVPGYYGNLRIDTNDTNPSVLVWGGADPNNIVLDGVGGAFTDGYYNATVQLYTPAPYAWCVWVNDTTGADNYLVDPSAAFLYVAANLANQIDDNTHIRVASGGVMWTLAVGWNLVSYPKNYSAIGVFSALEATQYIEDARIRYGLGASSIVMASMTNGQPSTISYDTYTYGVGGVDFLIGPDYAYWVYVQVAIPLIFVPGEDVVAANDPGMGLPGGVNTVTLNAGWTMVSTGLNPTSVVFGAGANAPLLSDIAGNQGNGAAGSIFWTGGSWTAGVHYAWYDQPGGIADSNTGVDYLTGGVALSSGAVWLPATQTFDTCVYDAWFGLWDAGLGYNNEVNQVYYASGFWVYSAGGAITYSVAA